MANSNSFKAELKSPAFSSLNSLRQHHQNSWLRQHLGRAADLNIISIFNLCSFFYWFIKWLNMAASSSRSSFVITFSTELIKSPSVWLHLRFDGYILTKPTGGKVLNTGRKWLKGDCSLKKAYFKLFKVGFCFTQFQRVIKKSVLITCLKEALHH